MELEATAAGRIIEVEERGIPMTEVPEPVQALLRAKEPGLRIDKIEAIWQVEKRQPAAFGFEGEDQRGQKVEIYISGDGKDVIN